MAGALTQGAPGADPCLMPKACKTAAELEGMRAAYQHGGPWLDSLMRYLDRSRRMIGDFLAERMPKVCFTQVEGTYLTLLDFRAYGLDEKGLRARLEVPGGVALSAGSGFGAPGCMRLNFGCPHAQLQEALERMERCLKDA